MICTGFLKVKIDHIGNYTVCMSINDLRCLCNSQPLLYTTVSLYKTCVGIKQVSHKIYLKKPLGDGESEFEARRRADSRCFWVTGRRGMTIAEAAEEIVLEARETLQRDLMLGPDAAVNWATANARQITPKSNKGEIMVYAYIIYLCGSTYQSFAFSRWQREEGCNEGKGIEDKEDGQKEGIDFLQQNLQVKLKQSQLFPKCKLIEAQERRTSL